MCESITLCSSSGIVSSSGPVGRFPVTVIIFRAFYFIPSRSTLVTRAAGYASPVCTIAFTSDSRRGMVCPSSMLSASMA